MWDLSGKRRSGPSLRFLGGFGGTPTWNLQNICAKASDFLRHGAHNVMWRMSLQSGSILVCFGRHAERTPMSSWILVPGLFKTTKFD